MNNKNNYLIIAGEVSGDLHGSNLARAILKKDPNIKLYGIGGDRMRDAGVELIYHIKDLAFLGIIEVIKHLPFLLKVKKVLKKLLVEKNIHKLILIDYPGFNIRFAKSVRELVPEIYYYIAPQVWAWGLKRLDLLKKLVKKVFVVFEFELDLFKNKGIDVEWVGHPLVDVINNYPFQSKEEFLRKYNLDSDKKIICIFPGSREQEIKYLLKCACEAVQKFNVDNQYQIIIAAIDSFPENFYRQFFNSENIRLIYNQNYEILKYSDFGIIKSGTSTLEATILKLPFLVIYKASKISYLIGKQLVNIDFISLPNILMNKKIVEEFIQDDATPENIYNELKRLSQDRNYYDTLKQNLEEASKKLGTGGTAEKVADYLVGVRK